MLDRLFWLCLYGSVAAFFAASWFGRYGDVVVAASAAMLVSAFVLAGLDWLAGRGGRID